MLRIAVAPCSPFSVTGELMREAAELARAPRRAPAHAPGRDRGRGGVLPRAVRLHGPWSTWRRSAGSGPTSGSRHCVHLSGAEIAAVRRDRHRGRALPELERATRGRQRRPSAPCSTPAPTSASAWTAPPRTRPAISRPSSARPSRRSRASRAAGADRPPGALDRHLGGARCLGREDELGSLEAGKLADVAVWDLTALGHAGIADPVAALVLGPRPGSASSSSTGGRWSSDGRLVTADEDAVAAALARQCALLAARAEVAA